MNLIFDDSTQLPPTIEEPFAIHTFYNRGFTIGDITNRPRNVYHKWKAEGLIPSHFGKDFWWQYQNVFDLEELENKGWEKLNFIEACWIKLVDSLRTLGYPKERIIRHQKFYFDIDDKSRAEFKDLLLKQKDETEKRIKEKVNKFGINIAKEDINQYFREIAAKHTFGRFDQFLLSCIYEREPLIFVASANFDLVPMLEGQKPEKEYQSLINTIMREPHIVIPFFKMVESMLFDSEYSHFSKTITGLNEAESILVKAIRDKKIKEITITKNNNQDQLTIRQVIGEYMLLSDEKSLLRILKNKEYKNVTFTDVDGKNKFVRGEKISKVLFD